MSNDLDVVMQLVRFSLSVSSGMFLLNDLVLLADYMVVPTRVETIRAYHLSVKVIHITNYQNRSAQSKDNDHKVMYHKKYRKQEFVPNIKPKLNLGPLLFNTMQIFLHPYMYIRSISHAIVSTT